MPLFRRAEWPRDHRDEFVAGALVGAVVIVLGYASGIGVSSAPGTAEAATPPLSPPAATAPQDTAPGDPGAQAPGSGTGMDMGGGWTGQVPVGTGEFPAYGGPGTDTGNGGADHPGHTGHGASPTPTPTLPPPPPPLRPLRPRRHRTADRRRRHLRRRRGTARGPAPHRHHPARVRPPQRHRRQRDGRQRYGRQRYGRRDARPGGLPLRRARPLSSLLGGVLSPSSSPSPSASPMPEATP